MQPVRNNNTTSRQAAAASFKGPVKYAGKKWASITITEADKLPVKVEKPAIEAVANATKNRFAHLTPEQTYTYMLFKDNVLSKIHGEVYQTYEKAIWASRNSPEGKRVQQEEEDLNLAAIQSLVEHDKAQKR